MYPERRLGDSRISVRILPKQYNGIVVIGLPGRIRDETRDIGQQFASCSIDRILSRCFRADWPLLKRIEFVCVRHRDCFALELLGAQKPCSCKKRGSGNCEKCRQRSCASVPNVTAAEPEAHSPDEHAATNEAGPLQNEVQVRCVNSSTPSTSHQSPASPSPGRSSPGSARSSHTQSRSCRIATPPPGERLIC